VNEQLIAAAEIGDEARQFLESDLGKCILGMAEQDLAEAQEALERVDRMDADSIRILQERCRFARTFKDRIIELFGRGEDALQAFIQQRGADES